MSDVTIQAALTAVKTGIGAVGKTGRNAAQIYNFRGVDQVVNAAAPLLNEHGVIVSPKVLSHSSYEYATSKGTQMRSLTVEVEYTFTGPAGDTLSCSVLAESSDSGDKAAPKAMSVAYRVALLQVLNLPTDDPDPDQTSHERATSATRAATQPEPTDWAALGWEAQEEHDTRKEAIKEKARALSPDAKDTLRSWAESTGLPKTAMSENEMSEYAAQVDALTLGDASGEPF